MEAMNWGNVGLALCLTALAGLCTGIGSFIAFFTNQTNRKFLTISLGFSAGVMIYVSMVEIFFKGRESLSQVLGQDAGAWVATLSFFGGIALIAIIDKLVPGPENPHEMHSVEEVPLICGGQGMPASPDPQPVGGAHMLRTGVFIALAVTIHNFPEGLATFIVALKEPTLGVSIAIAVALHNIPEGIAVSIPIFYATGSRRKAFAYSFLSGLAEPVGALVGFGLLMSIMSDTVFGIVFSGVAGIMVFISLDQLLPAAEKYGEHHFAVYGIIGGMALMALSLLLL